MIDYNKAISFSELLKASYECKRGVMWKDSVCKWMFHKIENIQNLRQSLIDNTYKIDKYTIFKIFEPKLRIICSTSFKDRVIQRSLCNNGLYEILTKPLIYDNGACQLNKGTNFTNKRLEVHLHKYFANNKTNKGYILKLDIKNYFGSTPHSELKKVIDKYVKIEEFRCYLYLLIDSFKDNRSVVEIKNDSFGKRGIALGSQLSQLLQLLFINDIDHHIKEKLKIKHYIRYMDDMILIHNDKQYLTFCKQQIEKLLSLKGLTLNPKSRIFRLDQSFQFCKIIYKLTSAGKIKKRCARSSLNRELRRSRKYFSLYYKEKKINYIQLLLHYNNWYGHFKDRLSKKQIVFMNSRLKKIISRYS